jgi:hypothetical protein
MAIYASTNGLIGVSGSNVVNLTSDLFDKDSWPDFNPESILAFQYENLYVGVHTTGAFSFDPITKDFSTLDIDEITVGRITPKTIKWLCCMTQGLIGVLACSMRAVL